MTATEREWFEMKFKEMDGKWNDVMKKVWALEEEVKILTEAVNDDD